MNRARVRDARASDVRASIEQHSKSFALASRLLPKDVGRDAAVLYAYCRRADDMIDLCADGEQHAELERLRAELDALYSGTAQPSLLLARTQRVLMERAVPRVYLDELLSGMAMDASGARYHSLPELLLYAYRVAGTVGLMMCHVMGVRELDALRHAAHLGIAMQLTNIARDVQEDFQRGRLYIPGAWLAEYGAPSLVLAPGNSLPHTAGPAIARATERLLREADGYYASADAGIGALSWRCGFAIRTARWVYSEIGVRVRAQACDPFAPRAVVSTARKLALVTYAAWLSVRQLPRSIGSSRPEAPSRYVTQPESLFMAAC